MNTRKRIISNGLITSGLIATTLLLGGATFAASGHPQPGDDRGRQGQPGNPQPGNPQPGNPQAGNQVRVRIALAGSVINGRTTEGQAEYRAESGRQGFRAQAENVNLPDGTVLAVTVNGQAVGTITLVAGRGELEINASGSAAPLIHPGDQVALTASVGTQTLIVVLTGQF